VTARPFVKWAGGKRQLAPTITALFPRRIRTYFEPFAGGGAVFFALAVERRFERAVLGDQNAELIEAYQVIRDDVDGVIKKLARLARRATDRDHYYAVRAQAPRDPLGRAARFIFLNRTCFNGLYRVNRKGQFNVPFGRYKNPTILDEANLRAVSQALKRVELVHGDFEAVALRAQRGDALYFDPPYIQTFGQYTADAFDMADHRRLVATFSALERRGVRILLSNSDNAVSRRLYRKLDMRAVHARRAISRRGTDRKTVTELLVVSRPKKVRARPLNVSAASKKTGAAS